MNKLNKVSSTTYKQARRALLLLAVSVVLMMTGVGIIFPIFARRIGELGGGVQTLGLMTVSFMLAQLLAAPVMGTLADRFGRKPIILLSLMAFSLANIGFLLARTTTALIIVRALQGGLTAGLYPSAMGLVGDLMPAERRARWIGVISAAYAAGFIFGPLVGGLLYDSFGYAAPFITSAFLGTAALVAAAVLVPETRPEVPAVRTIGWPTLSLRLPDLGWLPRPLTMFATLLFIDFAVVFAFAFVEPRMIFTMYEDLGWSTTQFGVLVGAYGLTAAAGQIAAGPLSDQFARLPIMFGGIILNALFYAGLIMFSDFVILVLVAIVAGLGEAFLLPALGAYYLDVAPVQHRSRVMGLKESAAALGGVTGPLMITLATGLLTSTQVYAVSFTITVASLVAGLLFLTRPRLPATALANPPTDESNYV